MSELGSCCFHGPVAPRFPDVGGRSAQRLAVNGGSLGCILDNVERLKFVLESSSVETGSA